MFLMHTPNLHIHTSTHTHVCTYVHTYVHTYICTYIRTYVHYWVKYTSGTVQFICLHMCTEFMYVRYVLHMYVHTYIYTYIILCIIRTYMYTFVTYVHTYVCIGLRISDHGAIYSLSSIHPTTHMPSSTPPPPHPPTHQLCVQKQHLLPTVQWRGLRRLSGDVSCTAGLHHHRRWPPLCHHGQVNVRVALPSFSDTPVGARRGGDVPRLAAGCCWTQNVRRWSRRVEMQRGLQEGEREGGGDCSSQWHSVQKN